MKKLLVAIPFTMLLTACGAPSVEDLIDDQELLGKTITKCNTLMMQGKDYKTEECENAAKAQSEMAGNMLKGLMNQFGG